MFRQSGKNFLCNFQEILQKSHDNKKTGTAPVRKYPHHSAHSFLFGLSLVFFILQADSMD